MKNENKERGIAITSLIMIMVILAVLIVVSIVIFTSKSKISKRKAEAENTVIYDTANQNDSNLPDVTHTVDVEEPTYTRPEIAEPLGGSIYTEETGEKVPIPKGFTIKKGTKVDTGLVVIAPDQSEFVWVPVPYAVAKDEESTVQKIKGTATIVIEATSDAGIELIRNLTTDNIEQMEETTYKVTENGDYVFEIIDKKGRSVQYTASVSEIEEAETENKAMAMEIAVQEENENENVEYRGILYEFEDTTSNAITNSVKTTLNNREPAYSEDSIDVKMTQEELQDDYNKMIESVTKYGGFFIGRYETSISGNTVASKVAEPMTAISTSGNTWYGMYEKQKNYTSTNSELKDVVQSSMVWGSQWDSMLNWILKGEEAKKVTAITNPHTLTKTGETQDDVINGIYDLGSNLKELTLEALYKDSRILRGGDSQSIEPPCSRASHIRQFDENANAGSRLALYIL